MLLTQTSPPLVKTYTSNPLSQRGGKTLRYGSVCMFDVAITNYSPLSENPHLEPRFPNARRSARESPPLIRSPRKLPGMMLRTKSTSKEHMVLGHVPSVRHHHPPSHPSEGPGRGRH